MGPVHFTDGFDRPDTIALGLDAPRLITVVAGALCAYAVMQAPLPFALRVCIAVLVAAVSAVLGWARYAGRPVLSWAWLALRFVLSPRSGGAMPMPEEAAEPVVAVAPDRVVVAEPPVDDGVPVWARWLSFEAQAEPPTPEATPAGVVESPREAPLVVVMDRASDSAPMSGPPEPLMNGASDSMPMYVPPDPVPTYDPRSPLPANEAPDPVLMGKAPASMPMREGPDSPAMREVARSIDDMPDPVLMHQVPDATPVRDTPHRTPVGGAPTSLDADEPRPAEVLQLPLSRPALGIAPAPAPAPVTDAPPLDTAPPPVFVGAPRRITFFSLNGGSGRTTLATEVACVLAARGRHLAADGLVRPLNVALLDLDLRSATVSVRLGIPQPTLADYVARGCDPAHLDACMVHHPSGVRALLGMPKPVAALESARVAEIIHQLERDGAQFIVIDVAGDLDAVTTWVLSAAHDIFVVLTPTARGVQDAYRTTAALRRLGLAHKLRYVVNRARGSVDLDEVMGDLGGRICAVIPDDPAVEDAENRHSVVALDGEGPAAAALHDLAALLYPTLASATRRTRMSWLPWRRRAG